MEDSATAVDQNPKVETVSEEPKVYPLVPTSDVIPSVPVVSERTAESQNAVSVTEQKHEISQVNGKVINPVDDSAANSSTDPKTVPSKVDSGIHVDSATHQPKKTQEYDLKSLALRGFNKQHTVEIVKALFGPHADNISDITRTPRGIAFVKFNSEDHCKAALEMLEANGELIVENAPRPILYSYKFLQNPNTAPNQPKKQTNNSSNNKNNAKHDPKDKKFDPKNRNAGSKHDNNDNNSSKAKSASFVKKSNDKPDASKNFPKKQKKNLKRLDTRPLGGKRALPSLMNSSFNRRYGGGGRVYDNAPKYEPPFLVSPFLNDRRDDTYPFLDSSRSGGYGYPANQSYDYNIGAFAGGMPMNSSFKGEPTVPALMPRYGGESFNGFDQHRLSSYRIDDTFNDIQPRERSRSPVDRRDRGGSSPFRNDQGKSRSGSLIESYCMLIAQRLERMNEQQQSYARMKIEEALYAAEFNPPSAAAAASTSNRSNNDDFRFSKSEGSDRYRSEQATGQMEPTSASYFAPALKSGPNVGGNRSRYQDSIFGGGGNLPSAADWMN